jgi:glutathione S-transferase
MDTMKLYSGPLSVFGAKAEIALREKGIPFELIMVRFDRATHYEPKHPEVLRINPKGQVPVLVDGAVEIFDSTQIFEYLEHRWPTPPLWPSAVEARAEARLLELKSDELFSPLVASLWRFRGTADHPERAPILAAIEHHFAALNRLLEHRVYLAARTPTPTSGMTLYFADFLGASRLRCRAPWPARADARPGGGAPGQHGDGPQSGEYRISPPGFL